MKSIKEIQNFIKRFSVKPGQEMRNTVLSEALEIQNNQNKKKIFDRNLNTGRIVMKKRILKLAAAALIIIAISIGMNQLSGPINFTSVAWGQIVRNIGDIDYFHYYEINNLKDDLPSFKEGWYSNGKLRSRSYNDQGQSQSFDNGTMLRLFDKHNNITFVGQSNIGKYNNIFEAMISDLLSFNYKQFQDKTPSITGEDFLIYEFEPSGEEADWIEKISVTVGKNSLIPIQIKTYYKTEVWYSISQLLIFDYEEPQKEDKYFEPPTEIKAPHGIGCVILGGKEVEIDINDAPGIKKAIVRLHTKFDGKAEDLLLPWRDRYKLIGQPMYFMEITFILDNGYRSNTAKDCPLWLDQGVSAGLGREDTWPDGIYRNIRYTPVLRATDKQDEFILELSCWLKIKQPNL